MRVLPLQSASALPVFADSAVINFSSETRIPVEQIVWRRRDNLLFCLFSAAFISLRYSSAVNSFLGFEKIWR